MQHWETLQREQPEHQLLEITIPVPGLWFLSQILRKRWMRVAVRGWVGLRGIACETFTDGTHLKVLRGESSSVQKPVVPVCVHTYRLLLFTSVPFPKIKGETNGEEYGNRL